MKISYAITLCNEYKEFERLFNCLIKQIDIEDEIILLCDKPKMSKELIEYVEELFSNEDNQIKVLEYGEFNGNFAEWKNRLKNNCSGDYIINFDADEYPTTTFLTYIKDILINNPLIDVYYVPRQNTVEGITEEHLKQWGWYQGELGINYPDFQMRIWKNKPEIKWKNKVHEVLEGYKNLSALPHIEPFFAIQHPKTIEKQEQQNNFYDSL